MNRRPPIHQVILSTMSHHSQLKMFPQLCYQ
ncbi:hypothetical protein MG5_01131 [Candida albicans P57072]|uniref:Uncharacterized protein n=1 Tax=Candida albicans P78048 TaxID=1094989 RepID=A0AB34PXX1_CANAX|nr:hypothetical protein MEO_01139 [Candida albicans P94015]KGQ97330.1 hypothetical protein MEU_01140 [Candida albicans P37005]KGR14394.1 hypothetical protein MG5_01131 [Candida albicans P57072]KGR16460.1 hypothetical protein MG3_01186 [Candida albicans P78048]KGR22804.1 hypothetical protein MG9_01139 [Candida albicans P37037]KGT71620.1 hypothetical protein MEK_01165 [Candida albicans 12C]KGU13409.1 hypothetical protein MEQ_01127 [Candida albicans P87]KGU16739.1 hypothetical protein MEY_01140